MKHVRLQEEFRLSSDGFLQQPRQEWMVAMFDIHRFLIICLSNFIQILQYTIFGVAHCFYGRHAIPLRNFGRSGNKSLRFLHVLSLLSGMLFSVQESKISGMHFLSLSAKMSVMRSNR